MPEVFQRLFERSEPQVMSLNVQAAMGPVHPPERSQFSLLMRHFLERFFNHETASPDGDAKARFVQIACAAGLPGFVMALYLWPVYHPVIVYPPHPNSPPGPPPYWLQVNHHFFYVLFSFVAMGLATVYEWDLFFPDLLDIFVLGTLPISRSRMFLSRVAAIAVLVFGFLLIANLLAPLTLVTATDPPDVVRFLAGHCAAVAMGGFFSAAFILAMEGILIAVLGERLFRRISLAVQGIVVTVLVMLLLLFPVLSGVTRDLLQSPNLLVLSFPPYWFLGIDQWLLEGSSALPIYGTLAKIGCLATLAATGIAMAVYPLAYMQRVRQLVEGSDKRSGNSKLLAPLRLLIHATAVRNPVQRAVFHFIGQTLQRVPRYRIYLVLYGGVGLAVVTVTVLRLSAVHGQLSFKVSADGIRTAIGIVAFWVIAGLRTAFVSSGNQRGGWIWRILHGSPPQFEILFEQLRAEKTWAALCSCVVTILSLLLLRTFAPQEMLSSQSTVAQFLVAAIATVLLTDAFFLNVVTVPFTSPAQQAEQGNLAFTLLRFFTFFPVVMWLSLVGVHWIETGWSHAGIAAAAAVVAHLWLRKRYVDVVRLHCGELELEEGEDDFPMKLGLRY